MVVAQKNTIGSMMGSVSFRCKMRARVIEGKSMTPNIAILTEDMRDG